MALKKNLEFEVNEEATLLPFLLSCLRSKSRNYVKGILKRGQVTVDEVRCTNHAHTLSLGQKVRVLQNTTSTNNNIGFPIIYEDDELILIDKPAGMLAIATENERENTTYHIVTNFVKSRNSSGRVFIVHRLDRETSGIMMLAKSERIKLALQNNWDDVAIHRGYTAVVEGKVQPSDGTIKSWLRQTKTLLVYSSKIKGDGKLAITNYKTVRIADRYSMLDISLETGRKNQIRVHMNDIGHPIVGDKKYGKSTDPFGRLGLHASVLTIKHPYSGKIMRFEAMIPSIFEKVF